MDPAEPRLLTNPDIRLRPMAQGCVLVEGEAAPRVIDALSERILWTCTRATVEDELIDALKEATGLGEAELRRRLEELASKGWLGASPPEQGSPPAQGSPPGSRAGAQDPQDP